MSHIYKYLTVCVDGLSGAGKSYIADRIAARLSEYFPCVHADTGAMFRAVGYELIKLGADLGDEAAVDAAVSNLALDVVYAPDGTQTVTVGGKAIADGELRGGDVSAAASKSAVYPSVRALITRLERAIPERIAVVMDGRDIGTVVLPDADVKIYVTADAGQRAARRYNQLREAAEASGEEYTGDDIAEIRRQIEERDYRDTHRAISPCVMAEDGVELDNTGITREQAVERAMSIVCSRAGKRLSGYAVKFTSDADMT